MFNNLRSEWQIYQDQWNALNPLNTINLVRFWDVWIRDFLRQFSANAVTVAERAYQALQDMAPEGDDEFEAGLVIIEDWVEALRNAQIDQNGLDG